MLQIACNRSAFFVWIIQNGAAGDQRKGGRAEGLAGAEVRARADVPTGMSHFTLCPHEYEHFFFSNPGFV